MRAVPLGVSQGRLIPQGTGHFFCLDWSWWKTQSPSSPKPKQEREKRPASLGTKWWKGGLNTTTTKLQHFCFLDTSRWCMLHQGLTAPQVRTGKRGISVHWTPPKHNPHLYNECLSDSQNLFAANSWQSIWAAAYGFKEATKGRSEWVCVRQEGLTWI